MAESLSSHDMTRLMRRAIALALSARADGNHPFGALLCDTGGHILLEARNTVSTTGDVTCHAERNLISAAHAELDEATRREAILVTSTEPCAMCSGAIFWSGIRTVIYGMKESHLYEMAQSATAPAPMMLNLPCSVVFNTCPGHPTRVIGPLIEDEARKAHEGFW
jgi:tRNA(Arg) A34 adenosine deaminase TadA